MSDVDEALREAFEAARTEYNRHDDENGTLGHASLVAKDEDVRDAVEASDIARVTIDEDDWYRISLSFTATQVIMPREAAYREFIETMNEHGFMDDAWVDSRAN